MYMASVKSAKQQTLSVIDHPVGPKGRLLCYELRPYNQKDGITVTPVDSEKTITRLLLTVTRSRGGIKENSLTKEMTVK